MPCKFKHNKWQQPRPFGAGLTKTAAFVYLSAGQHRG